MKFLECVRDTFLTQHVTEPTRYRLGNRPTCDDLIFSSCETDISNIRYDESIGLSDHLTINCDINTTLTPTNTKKVTYKYDKADFTRMKEMFNVNWEEKLRNKSAEESMDIFEIVYNQAVKECVPTT